MKMMSGLLVAGLLLAASQALAAEPITGATLAEQCPAALERLDGQATAPDAAMAAAFCLAYLAGIQHLHQLATDSGFPPPLLRARGDRHQPCGAGRGQRAAGASRVPPLGWGGRGDRGAQDRLSLQGQHPLDALPAPRSAPALAPERRHGALPLPVRDSRGLAGGARSCRGPAAPAIGAATATGASAARPARVRQDRCRRLAGASSMGWR
jgi:hypothetical protein